jgi:sodium/proline symporter
MSPLTIHYQINTVFFLYIAVLLVIGFLASRVIKNLSDYMLAGRHLSAGLTALGAGASDMSSWLLMALPGAAFLFGMDRIWLPIGLTLGAYLNWQFEAKRLRIFTEVAHNSLTIPAYLQNRFHDKSRTLRTATGLVILLFFTLYVSANFVAGGFLLEQVIGLSYTHSVLICAGVIVLYTCMGGFVAVSWVDFIQGCFMFAALLIVPCVAFDHLGGLNHTVELLLNKGPGYFNAFNSLTFLSIASLLGWGLGYFGQPHIIVRFMAIRTTKDIPLARLICMAWMVLALYGAIFTGLTGAAYVHAHALTLDNPENIFLLLAQALFNPWIAGLLLAAVLSAIMSVSSAMLLSAASSLSEDFYHPFFAPKASQKRLIIVARLGVILIACIAVLIALTSNKTILQLVSYAWAGLGASFGPVILLSLYWKRMTRNAAIAGIFTGAISVILWELIGANIHAIFDLYSIIPAFFVSTFVIIIVSLMDKKPEHSVQMQFDEAMKQIKQV